ncbi:MAG: efflux transporter outer membrane subunit [Proteobacteria bacterium]|nr:efflux transporter outer membrane subunit [Pseudomonadota bacterium]
MTAARAACLVLLAVLPSCMVGPDYAKPETAVPPQFAEAGPWQPGEPQDSIARGDWWAVFGDPVLNGLQVDAVRQNPDLKAVAQRVLQAQAVAGIARGALYPEIDAGGIAQRFANNSNFATLVQPATITTNSPVISDGFKAVPLYAAYEIDFWGRVRRQAETAMAELAASVAAYQTALLTLNGEVAQTYFEVRTTDELLRIVGASVDLHRNTMALFRARRTDGLSSDIALSDVETALRETEARKQTLEVQRVKLVNKLAVLVGTGPEQFALARQPAPRTVPAVPVGLPSEVLQRRPDVARAEREMAAANAQIGVAIAAYFPSIVLTSSVGFESFALSTLTQPTSNIWGVGLSLFQQLFNAGRTGLNVDRARAAYMEKVALYEALLLKVFQEVETALAGLRLLEQQARFQQQAIDSAGRTVTLTNQRFQAGLVSQLDLLVAQRAQLAADGGAVQIANDRLLTTVALIKALGGGWQDRASQAPAGSTNRWAPALPKP